MVTPTTSRSPAADPDAELDDLIRQDPNRPGRHYARLAESGLQVQLIADALRRNGNDVASAARRWNVSDEEARAALRYYERHRALFDAFFLLQVEVDSA